MTNQTFAKVSHKTTRKVLALAGVLLGTSSVVFSHEASAADHALVFFGTYTRGQSEGIYVYRMNLGNGRLSHVGTAKGIANPSFLAIHPNGRYFYSVNEVGDQGRENSGAVTAFSIDSSSGNLVGLNQQSSRGAGPCHLVVDSTGRNVLVANYGGGSVAVLPIGQDGRLESASSFIQHQGSSVNPRRQQEPHAHSINLDYQNRFAFAADLGLDKILIYRFDPELGSLLANDIPHATVRPGAGPRHFAIHPSNKYAYVINELHCTVDAFSLDAQSGRLSAIQNISTLPPGQSVQQGYSTAEVQVHTSGKFLYGSNRGHDSIVVFAINADSGELTYVENESTQGRTPRNFGIDPTGQYLLAANQSSNTVVVFRIDPRTGELNATGTTVEVPTPVCVKFLLAAS